MRVLDLLWMRGSRVVRDPTTGVIRYRFAMGAAGKRGAIGTFPPAPVPGRLQSLTVQPTVVDKETLESSGQWSLSYLSHDASTVRMGLEAPLLIEVFPSARSAQLAKRALEHALFERHTRVPSFAKAIVVTGVGIGLLFVLAALAERINPSVQASLDEVAVHAQAPTPAPAALDATHTMDYAGSNQVIVFGSANAKPNRIVFVFSDPKCPACQTFDRQINELNKSGVAVAVFPVAFKPESLSIAESILCSPAPQAAWKSALQGKLPPPAACKMGAEVMRMNNLIFRNAGMTVTPTIVLPNDRRMDGAASVREILAALPAP